MTKFRRQLQKAVALPTLVLMLLGMFCIGMFMPARTVQAETLPGHNHHDCLPLPSSSNMDSQLAPCCLNRPHNDQAIITVNNFEDNFLWVAPALCAEVVAAPAGLANYNYSSADNIFPPPEREALRTVIKRE